MSDTIDQITAAPAAASPIAPGTLDRKARPFDPARHIPKMHPLGYWMCKGGRKSKSASPSSSSTSSPPAPTAPGASANSSPSPAASPADATQSLASELAANMPEVTVDDGPAPDAKNSPATGDAAPAGGGSFIPPDDPAPVIDGKAELMEDAKSSAEDHAEVACQTLYTLTGLVTGQTKEAQPAKDEHAALRRTLAAYFRARGWVAVGTIAVVVSIFAYFIRTGQKEATSQVARGWWQRLWAKQAPRSVNTPDRATSDAAGSATPAAEEPRRGVIVVE